MPDQEAIQRGRDFEQIVADYLSISIQPGSGNKFYAKNDASGRGLSASCKSQKRFTWSEINHYLKQSIDDAHGTGSIAILVLNDDDNLKDDVVMLRLSDFVRAFQEEIKIPDYSESKGIEKRKTAEIPLMLR